MDDLIGAVFFLYMNYRNVSFHVLLVFTAIKDYCRDAGIISLLVFKAKKLIRQTKNKYRHTKHTATTTSIVAQVISSCKLYSECAYKVQQNNNKNKFE